MKGRKFVKAITAAVAAALVTVPVAQARPAVDAQHSALLNKETSVWVSPAEKIRQVHRHLAQLNPPPAQIATSTASTGIDWSDVGIGASAGFGMALLTGGVLIVTRRRLVGA